MRQKLGQHFLKDKSVLKKIAEATRISSGDTIIEIGGGNGELTRELIEKMESYEGASLTVVEKDPVLAEKLRSLSAEDNYKVINKDVRDVLELLVLKNNSDYKLVGNLPYYITGNLIDIIKSLPRPPKLCVFMVQKEVAIRMASRPPKMNRMAAAVQYWANAEVLFFVAPRAFRPPPKVESAAIRLVTKRKENWKTFEKEAYYASLGAIFKQPRKTILNNISMVVDKKTAGDIIKKIGLQDKDRPQNMSVEDISAIACLIAPFIDDSLHSG